MWISLWLSTRADLSTKISTPYAPTYPQAPKTRPARKQYARRGGRAAEEKPFPTRSKKTQTADETKSRDESGGIRAIARRQARPHSKAAPAARAKSARRTKEESAATPRPSRQAQNDGDAPPGRRAQPSQGSVRPGLRTVRGVAEFSQTGAPGKPIDAERRQAAPERRRGRPLKPGRL